MYQNPTSRHIYGRVLTLILALTFLAGCEQPEPPVTVGSRPVKSVVAGNSSGLDQRTFPAVVDAIRKADISFRVSGKLDSILVKEGDRVKKGQLLATLDDTDFKIALDDRKASFETAKANYERAKELVEKGAISRVDHDNIRAKFFTAEAALKEAEQNLEYTRLLASFDGVIAKRYVENFEEILKSKTIFSLEDVSSLKLIIDVPENLMIMINQHPERDKRKVVAEFDRIPGKRFDLEFLEAATKADPSSKTFKVTLTMPRAEGFNILPGMTATVIADIFPDETSVGEFVTLPVSAVVADSNKQPVVWVVDENDMTVHAKPVGTGLIAGDSIQVSGLNGGERVVTAGAAFLREGMKVTLLKTGEQP
jgi:RND family efflux transporter MFP subunit